MKQFLFVALPAIIYASPFAAKDQANQVLNRGQNTGIFSSIRGFTLEEAFRSSNMERECVEESCTYEEYAERAENDIKDYRKIVPGDVSQIFERVYKACRDKVQQAGLDGSQ